MESTVGVGARRPGQYDRTAIRVRRRILTLQVLIYDQLPKVDDPNAARDWQEVQALLRQTQAAAQRLR